MFLPGWTGLPATWRLGGWRSAGQAGRGQGRPPRSTGTGDQLKIDGRPMTRTGVKDRLAGMEPRALAGTTR